jgi:hypothetical protein
MKVLKWPAGGRSYGQAPWNTLPPPVVGAAPTAAGFGVPAAAVMAGAGVAAGGAWQAASAAAPAPAPSTAIRRRRLRTERLWL